MLLINKEVAATKESGQYQPKNLDSTNQRIWTVALDKKRSSSSCIYWIFIDG
jgi:hypothetical protein